MEGVALLPDHQQRPRSAASHLEQQRARPARQVDAGRALHLAELVDSRWLIGTIGTQQDRAVGGDQLLEVSKQPPAADLGR